MSSLRVLHQVSREEGVTVKAKGNSGNGLNKTMAEPDPWRSWPRGYGVRREAERHAALARAKAPSPLRSAGAVQNTGKSKLDVSDDRTTII